MARHDGTRSARPGEARIYRAPDRDVEIPETDLTSFVFERADEHQARPALVDAATGWSLTYGQLAHRVSRVAGGLSARGFGPGDVVALYVPNIPEFAQFFHGALAAGGACTTANPLYTAVVFNEHYNPKIVGYLNNYKLAVVKVLGEFVWHKHDETDDFFLVLRWHLTIQLRDRDVELSQASCSSFLGVSSTARKPTRKHMYY